MTTARRGVAGIAAAALTAAGLSVLGVATAPAAHAAPISVDNAEFRWGISKESGTAGFAPGTWNLMSAGKIGNPGGSKTLNGADEGATWTGGGAAAGWKNSEGNVTIEDLQSDGSYAPTTWNGTRQNAAGVNTSVANGVSGETELVFGSGTGTLDPAANTASIEWDGDATVLYYSGMTFFYLSDPELTVNADGTGSLTATVGGYGADMDDPTQWVAITDREVTLADFDDADVTATGVTGTPNYLGVDIDDTGYGTAQAVTGANWGSFPQSFVDFQQLTGQSSYWYSSGGAADARKVAAPFRVELPVPEVSVSATEIPSTGTYEVTVTGENFRPSLATGVRPPLAAKPGGAYVVFGKFADSWRPSTGALGATRVNSSQKWAVLASDMETIGGPSAGAVELSPDGSFTTSVTVDKSAIDAKATAPTLTNYGIYTYPGSGAVQAQYETYTPITFTDATSAVEVSVTQAPTPSAQGSATIAVDAPGAAVAAGTVSVTGGAAADASLVNGSATVVLPKAAPGTHSVAATYAGVTTSASYTVGQVATTLQSTWKKKPTAKKKGKLVVTASAAGLTPTGQVVVKVRNAKGKVVAKAKGNVVGGVVTLKLPKLAKGTYTVAISYAGDSQVLAASTEVKVKAKRR